MEHAHTPKLTQYSFSKLTSKQVKAQMEDEMPQQNVLNFNETAILQRYHRLQYNQYRQLGNINMSVALKQKLFGFSADSVFTNEYNPEELVIENHPVKGKIIMDKCKHLNYQHQKRREFNIKNGKLRKNSEDNSYGEGMQNISSGWISKLQIDPNDNDERVETELRIHNSEDKMIDQII